MTNVQNDRLAQPEHTSTAHTRAQAHADRLLHQFYRLLDIDSLCAALVQIIVQETQYERALLLLRDTDSNTLVLTAFHETQPARRRLVRGSHVQWNPSAADIQQKWLQGEAQYIQQQALANESSLYQLLVSLDCTTCFSIPLLSEEGLSGLVLAMGHTSTSHSANDDNFLMLMAPGMAGAISNALRYNQTIRESATRLQQLTILNQIDRELNDHIKLDHIFSLTLDWAIRYTNAQAASLALFDENTSDLHTVAEVGYALPTATLQAVRTHSQQTTAHRVARSGRTEVIPDVAQDKDYIALSATIRSQLIAPITREDRVIAVITIESKRLNSFTEDHVAFVEKLSARAGVAIDNARLFSEAVRAKTKLEQILQRTADIVIVLNQAGTLEMMNPSALTAFGLQPDRTYTGIAFDRIFTQPPLRTLYGQATATNDAAMGEVTLPDGRTFYANIAECPNVGWIIVMHDITSLKKAEQVKSELLSAISHDLRQPLGIMHGFTELLMMNAADNDQVSMFVPHIQRAVSNMNQLIDDQLDLARLEAGVELQIDQVAIRSMLKDCIESLNRSAQEKDIHVELSVGDNVTVVNADRRYIYRVFMNIIGNAIKYTPTGGHVLITVEESDTSLRFNIQDNGFGISPEDQARVFDRFFRVRRPENDGIDGTGLGLAIVRRLVELHHGQVSLTSTLGKGSTFTVVLPLNIPDSNA